MDDLEEQRRINLEKSRTAKNPDFNSVEIEKDYTPEYENKNTEEQKKAKLEKNRNSKNISPDNSYENFKEIYGEEISEADVNDIIIKKPTIPNFPYFIFSLAASKDFFLDFLIELARNGSLAIPFAGIPLYVFFTVVGWVISILIYIIIFIWIFNKSTFIRKKIIKKGLIRIVLFFLGEAALAAFPFTTLNVYLIYKSEYGVVKKIIDVVEKIEK